MIKYDGMDPNKLGPSVHGLYDLLHQGVIDRAQFNQKIGRAEYQDEIYNSLSQYERENKYHLD